MNCRIVFGLVALSLAGALPTRTDVEQASCKPMDLIFLLDTSRSIYIRDFEKQIEFVNQIVSDLAIGPGPSDTRVGAVTFADRYWPQFYLRSYNNKKKLQTRIKFIRHKNGRSTDTGIAIKYMVGTMFREYVGGRKNSSKIAIVITDGRSQNPQGTKKAAKAAKDAGIQMFAIGVGRNVYEEELDDIGSDPVGNHVFLVKTFAQLGSIKDMLPKSACEASQKPSTTIDVPQSSSTTTYASKKSSTTENIPEVSSTTFISTTGYDIDGSSTMVIVPDNSSKVGYTPSGTPATRNVPEGSTTTGNLPHRLSTTTNGYVPVVSTRKIKKTEKEDRKDLWNMINKKTVIYSNTQSDRALGEPQDVVFNDNPTDYCGEKDADIYFVLDSSSSIWPIDFEKQLAFVNDMIDKFNIDNTHGRIRIGVVVFSSFIKNVVALDSKRSKDELKRQVTSIDYMSGRTNTSDAIKFVRKYGFRKGVARDSAVKIAIVMTDGISRSPNETTKESELARQENINLFAIGIGNKVDKAELERIANDPDNKHVFHVSSFEYLDRIKDILTISACAVIPDQPSNIKACDPRSKAEIVFVYDAFALGFRKTQMIGNMVYEVVSRLNVSSGNIMVGRLTDNCPSSTNIQLGSTNDATKFAMFDFPGISRLLISLQSTFTGLPGMKQLGILIVDDSTQGVNAARQFMKGNKNFELMVIAIGESQKLRFAEDLASEPNRIYLVNLEKYSSLTTSFTKILERLCEIIKPPLYPNLPLPA